MAEKPSRIDHQALAQALNAEHSAVRDVAYGQGNRLTTEAGHVLEVFPAAVRLTGPDLALVVQSDQLTPRVGEDWVSFDEQTDTHTRTVAVRRSGDLLFRSTLRAPQTPGEAQAAATLPNSYRDPPGRRSCGDTDPNGDPSPVFRRNAG